jgi:FkbM family methyltransferase
MGNVGGFCVLGLTSPAPSSNVTPSKGGHTMSSQFSRFVHKYSPRGIRDRLASRMPSWVNSISVDLPGGESLSFDHVHSSEFFKQLYWKGFNAYEPNSVKLFYSLSQISEIIFDVGAYFGYYSLVAAKANQDAVIHGFEPVPESYELYRHYADLNNCHNVTAHNMCVDMALGKVEFFLPDRSLSAIPNIGSLRNRFKEDETFSDRGHRKIEVQSISIDAFVKESGVSKVDLIKIDTEETEGEVIESGIKTIERYKPDILLEVIFRNKDAVGALRKLQDLDYQIYDIGEAVLRPLAERISFDEIVNKRDLHHDRSYGELFCTCRTDEEISGLYKDGEGSSRP